MINNEVYKAQNVKLTHLVRGLIHRYKHKCENKSTPNQQKKLKFVSNI